MTDKKPTRPRTPEVCPVCGEEVPPRAMACPECGADHNSGWREEAGGYDALALPDDGFDYETFVEQEFDPSPKPGGIKTIWWITAILVLVIFFALYFFAG